MKFSLVNVQNSSQQINFETSIFCVQGLMKDVTQCHFL